MLSKDQIEKLQPFLLHPLYGKILENAVHSWTTLKLIPVTRTFGIDFYRSYISEIILPSTRTCACLLGAALMGKKYSENLYEILGLKTKFEFYDLVQGFDNGLESEFNSKAINFATTIKIIVKPKKF